MTRLPLAKLRELVVRGQLDAAEIEGVVEPKYNNAVQVAGDVVLDSKAEAREWPIYRMLERAGAIRDLEAKPTFELLAGLRDRQGVWHRPITYTAEWAYTDCATGRRVVVEVKGYRTEVWRIKHKLFLTRYPDVELRVISVEKQRRRRR